MIRLVASACFTFGILLTFAKAAEPPPKTGPKIQLPVPKGDSQAAKDHAQIIQAANKALQEAKPDEVNKVLAQTAAQLVAHVRKYPKDESTLDVLTMAIGFLARSPVDGAKTLDEAIELLKPHLMATTFAKTPRIRQHLRMLVSGVSDSGNKLVRDVIADHPDPLTRAHAASELIKALNSRVSIIKSLTATEEGRANAEKQMGKDEVQKLLDSVPQAKKDIEIYRTKLRTELKGQLPDLEVGGVAPETVSVNLDGKTVKLSELKGKVVVLYFWTTGCVPCRAMLPPIRELVKSMDGRPFVFVSISLDDEKETLAAFLRKEEMPWTHWWDAKKVVAEQWELRVLSTLYVVDSRGEIQFKSEGGYDPKSGVLEKKVEELVKAAERAK